MAKKNTAAATTKAPAKIKKPAAPAKAKRTASGTKSAQSTEQISSPETTAAVVQDPNIIVDPSNESVIASKIITAGEGNTAATGDPDNQELKPAETVTTGPEITPEGEPVKRKISVVIPYLASAAKGDEIMYALRGWAENFDDFEIVIIGDKPDFVSDLVIHIPHVATLDSPQLDVTAKLLQAIASDLVSEDFILTNDDIYPVNFIELADIKTLKCSGVLGETKSNAGPKYAEKLYNTRALLQNRKLPIFDYSTHTPYLFNKVRLAKVIERYKADQQPLLISSLYFNTCFKTEVPDVIKGGVNGDFVGYVYKADPNVDVLLDAFNNRKFINHNSLGYSAVLPFLENHFQDKSIFEL